MKLELDKYTIKLVPETSQDEVYLETVLGLQKDHDKAAVERVALRAPECLGVRRTEEGHPMTTNTQQTEKPTDARAELIRELREWAQCTVNAGLHKTAQLCERAAAMLEAQSKVAPVVLPLTDEQIEKATGTKIGQPLFLVAKGFTLAIENAHGITGEKA